MRLTDIGTVKKIMEQNGIHFRKSLGQNFLISESVPRRIAEAGAGKNVLEIGPGIGTLTRELSARSERVVAVEIDSSLIPVLGQTLADCPNVSVVNEDIMKLDLPAFLVEQFGDAPISVCANLPYYITTPILMHLLESDVQFAQITVMIQREVADRICAAPGSAAYGAITPAVAYYGKAEKLFRVPPGAFLPAPKVESVVIRILPHAEPPVETADPARLRRIIRAAFAQRRKTLVNALSAEFPALGKERIAAILTVCGIDKGIRGEKLSLAEFAAIERELFRLKNNC